MPNFWLTLAVTLFYAESSRDAPIRHWPIIVRPIIGT